MQFKGPKPTIPEVLPIMRTFQKLPGNGVGGVLHIVLDDGNVANHHVKWCLTEAELRGDREGAELAGILLKMTRTQRKKLADMFYAA